MNLHYTDTGRGFPVVFVHAFPLDGRMWEPNASAVVEAGFRAIVPDLPGFGQSHTHPEISTMDMMASGVAAILDEEKIEKAVFCGLSMGGYALFSLYRFRPELFAGLVLCDTTADSDAPEKREGRAAMVNEVRSGGTEVLVRDLLPNLVSSSTMEKNQPLVSDISAMILDQPESAVCAALRGMAERPDSKELLGKLGIPVKLIFGAEDAVTGETAAKALESGIRDAELVFLDRAGHYSNLESAENFNIELISYLNSLSLTL